MISLTAACKQCLQIGDENGFGKCLLDDPTYSDADN